MVNLPLVLLPRCVVRYGLFQHAILPPLLSDVVPEDTPLHATPFALCETPLPANFCTCGRYALFEDDAMPDAPEPPPPAQESPPCPHDGPGV